ncbi:MAG: anaerobic glycerol-3-phosphate dehydrogenase subunit C [Planctomycetaceae bacterium]
MTEDLAGLLKGELRSDPIAVSMYSSDASIYQVEPLGVAFPKDRDDVVTLARYSSERKIPLIARGAGTGVAGQSIGAGLIVDFSRHMRQVVSIGEDTVRVEPGIVRDQLNNALAATGRYFPPDPSNTAVSTIGGMLAVDAAGSHSVRVGSTRDHVERIETVLADGSVVEFGNESLAAETDHVNADGTGDRDAASERKREFTSRLAQLLAGHEGLIQERQPQLVRNCSGYYLRGVLTRRSLHIPRLLVGSEGTLALFTAATLHTAPLPAFRGVVLLLFGQTEPALRSVQSIARQQPSACDLLDRRLLTLAREADPRFEQIISPTAEAALIVEQTGFSDRQIRDRISMVIKAVRDIYPSVYVAYQAYTNDDVEFLWSLPGKVVPMLNRLKGYTRPIPFVEDVAVPPEAIHEFLLRAQKVFQVHEVTASLYSHAAAGQLHLRPFLPAPSPQDGPKLEAIARDLYQVVFSVGGTISGEHGDGLSRTAFIRSQYGPLYRVFQQVKELFDPQNLLNPNKIVSDDPHITQRNIRPAAVPAPQVVDLQLRWEPQDLTRSAASCNGCGTCRTQDADSRMCPFLRIDVREEASPRAKANVMRDYANGILDPREIASPTMKALSDLCFNCKQCQLECPANVDIPQLMIEAKAAYVAANGLFGADWLLSRIHSFGALGSTASMAVNWTIGNPTARWLLEKTLGISRLRKLPLFARRSFLRSASRDLLRLTKNRSGKKPVVYFVSEYANFYDTELARAFVAVLKHNGIPVYAPPGQTGSGMAMITAGDLAAARVVAERNVRELAELAREGLPIICTEPSAAICLKQEYPKLLDHPDVELVASQVIDAGAYLESLHAQGQLRTDFAPLDLDVGYHTPCHLKALQTGTPLWNLMSLIPQLRLHKIEEGCSGMAGAFGLTEENFPTSIRIGWKLISRMRAGDLNIGVTECSSCRIQMEQGATVPTLHPIKLMALSYGLMPEIQKKLTTPLHKLVMS